MVHEEPSYVVRQQDGTTLSFPSWMTDLASADVKITDEVHLSIVALSELHRLTTNALSSIHSSTNDGGDDEAKGNTTRHAIQQPRPRSYTDTSGGGKTCGKDPADGMATSHGKKHQCGGEK
jgi:hypothetical protein